MSLWISIIVAGLINYLTTLDSRLNLKKLLGRLLQEKQQKAHNLKLALFFHSFFLDFIICDFLNTNIVNYHVTFR